MKKFIVATFVLATIFSCSTDFDVIADWQDITIVYGLLDPTDTAQYIKINKAFLDPKTSALIIAQIPDSLYYDNLDVQLEQYTNGNYVNSFPLTKVNGNLEGYPKEDGIFAKEPNWLYKTETSLDCFLCVLRAFVV